jgi:hypothetical protein
MCTCCLVDTNYQRRPPLYVKGVYVSTAPTERKHNSSIKVNNRNQGQSFSNVILAHCAPTMRTARIATIKCSNDGLCSQCHNNVFLISLYTVATVCSNIDFRSWGLPVSWEKATDRQDMDGLTSCSLLTLQRKQHLKNYMGNISYYISS